MNMRKLSFRFNNSLTDYYFDAKFSQLQKLVDKKNAVILTDEKILLGHASKLNGWNMVVLKAGEEHKTQETVDAVIENLIETGADRQTVLIGVGGGVITDLTGYVASIYMRGLAFGYVPTSLLGMVDAAIGGKNGVDVGVYKNMVGTIRQPSFLLYDYGFLKTLPEAEWINGFAEIIKHACIKDAAMFRQLEQSSFEKIRNSKKLVGELVERNARIKTKIVQRDEFEKGERRLLNFGHTLGHALENLYQLPHGQAVSLGISAACELSNLLSSFNESQRVIDLLDSYGLPTDAEFDKEKVIHILKMDKKRVRDQINYVLLDKIGKGKVQQIPIKQLERFINQL
jgi:3-dehydroquinate synthase